MRYWGVIPSWREPKWFTIPVDGNGKPYWFNYLMVLGLMGLSAVVWAVAAAQVNTSIVFQTE